MHYERDIASYGSVLKKIPQTRRTRNKGEKVYPIDLNLKNADLVEAVRVIADVIGLNYSIDPKVKGTVSVRATGRLGQSELLSIMETLLSINGATMIRADGLYKIVPSDKAFTQGMPVYSQGTVPAGMRTQVVFLDQTPAKEMADALKPLVSPAGAISAVGHNFIVLSDNPDNLDRLVNLITLLDSRGLAESSVKVIRVKNTGPGEVIKELETIFSSYGTGGEKGRFGVSFMPVERLNAVMILAPSRALMDRASYWIKQLDMQTDLLANMHVYQVENYKAKNLASLLTQVYGGTPAADAIKETGPERTTTGGTSGLEGGLGTSGGLGGGRSGQTGTAMQTTSGTLGTGANMLSAPGEASPLSGASASAAPLKERATALDAASGTTPKEGVRIIPDEENNLLVIMAPPYEWKIISRLLKQLDIMPRQVLNEVLIAEVRLTDDLKYGLEFLLGQSPTTATESTSDNSGALVASSTSTTIVPGTIQGVDINSPASAQFAAASGLTFVALDTANKLKGLINLLSSEGKVNILASPHIMAANNQEARIMIGEEVPILSSQSIPLVSQTTSFQTNTVQYRNTGIILTVKPQINAKGLVTLEIAQEVSNATATTTGVTSSPTFTVRHAKTQLITGDNQTVVLGGLIREDLTETQAGIPGLRRIPLLGPLFGSTGVSRQKTELVVLITPHIVTNLQEGARVTHEMKEKVGVQEIKTERRTPEPSTYPREVAPPAY
ncbi:type II secretion system secretin GspD [Desulfobacca acetoxidans]|nr:type II secretion system secretin GspD [Desulfobacca acetoxidans]